MKVGDLVEYIPGTTAIARRGIVLETWHMDGITKYLCHWNIPDTASHKSKWYAKPEQLRLLGGIK
tara:strand:- start:513 stop:707 length:195 start_codon:yes stop_codon:yes gene_type:complete